MQNKGFYLNLTVVIQCNQSIFSPSNSNIHLHKGSVALRGTLELLVHVLAQLWRGPMNKCSSVQIASCGTAIASLLSQTLLPRSSNWLCWPRPWDEPPSSPLSCPWCHTIVCFCLPSSINLGNPHYWADVPFSMAFLESVSFGMQIWGVGVGRRGFFSIFPSLFYNGPTLGLCSSRE